MKKALSIILSILMLISAFVPFSAFAENSSGTWGTDGTWELVDGVLTISGTGKISDLCFIEWKKPETVIINEGVTTIGEKAFYACSNLKEVYFPESLIGINKLAFYKCEKLEKADLPSNLKYVGVSAFKMCYSLKKINIPKSIEVLYGSAFSNCLSAKGSIVIPKNAEINRLVFYNCDSITEVHFEEGFIAETYNFAGGSFSECDSLKKVYIPGSMKYTIADFSNCKSLADVTISEGVESIRGFGGCASLEKITLPKSAKTISSFSGCKNLKTVKIQGKLDCIEQDCFVNCPSLKSIKIPYGVEKLGAHSCGYIGVWNEKTQRFDFSLMDDFKIFGKKCKALTDYCKENGFTFIDMYDVKNASTTMKSQTYNGKSRKATVTVKLAGTTLTKDTDYTVKYSNTINVGTAKVTITGKGKYKGTLTKTYKINPQPTELTKLTAGSKSFKAYWKKVTTQTTGYQIQYSTYKDLKNAKTVTISSNKTGAKTIKSLKANKKYFVRIRTYKTVNKKKYYSNWSESMKVTTK